MYVEANTGHTHLKIHKKVHHRKIPIGYLLQSSWVGSMGRHDKRRRRKGGGAGVINSGVRIVQDFFYICVFPRGKMCVFFKRGAILSGYPAEALQ